LRDRLMRLFCAATKLVPLQMLQLAVMMSPS
jgi:hypothetical protein